MRYSKIFGKTTKTTPSDATLTSHKLLLQAGFIRESTAGRYYFLPLGNRVQNKIIKLVREEMDKTGAQELISPIFHPFELWQETNRNNSVGFELTTLTDRRGATFVPGGTAEEMMVDLLRKFQISYRDLPINIYQFSTKFRDELRARGGLLRVREFIMKDAYSFHTTDEDFKKEYQNMWGTYDRIYKKLGLLAHSIPADNGYIGGDYCHEFIVESPVGESTYFVSEDGKYQAHEDIAEFKKEKINLDEPIQELKQIKAERGTTMEDGAKLHNKPLNLQIKDVLYVDDQNRFILAIIRGDFDVNETKLKHITGSYQLRPATEEEIRNTIHSEPGFISPVKIKESLNPHTQLLIVADDSLRTIRNAYGGANKKYLDLFNINIDRDYQPDLEGDIALAQPGYLDPTGKSKLIQKKGIEVGNIFSLGTHYSTKMNNATFIDEQGKAQPYIMGCYGLGIGRTLASIVEIHHDERGIIWPDSIAPYQVHLIGLDLNDATINQKVENIYQSLLDNDIDVLYDDRDIRAGEKFADADLIGIPNRMVISKRSGDKIEFKLRNEKDSQLLTLEEILNKI